MYTVSNVQLNRLLNYLAEIEQFAFLDTSRPGEDNRSSYLFLHPVTRLQCTINNDAEEFLDEIQHYLDQGYYVAGWFGYEFGELLLQGDVGPLSKPNGENDILADLGVFTKPLRFDHLTGTSEMPPGIQQSYGPYRVRGIHPNIEESEYLQALDNILEYIRAGDTYQVNYTLKLLFDFEGSPEAFYSNLRRNQSVSYGAFIRWGEERVMSFSPELFFRKNANTLTVRPMKGTLHRGRNLDEDGSAREFLQSDQKNRSENVMIVDLLRNDLGRVLHEAGGGQVKVRSLFDVETYESLFQMTSTIEGLMAIENEAALTLHTLFRGIFPCGSVTGAPKIRTMEIIAEQEKAKRGVYTGAIGYLAPDGEAVFNVPIRTLVLRGDKGEMGIGSGITHDSVPEDEWQECLLKGRFLTNSSPEFSLIETLFWSPESGYLYLTAHLERLKGSAEYFYFQCDTERIKQQLLDYVDQENQPKMVRMTLDKDGLLKITDTNCQKAELLSLPAEPEMANNPLPVVRFSNQTVDSESPWCMHKTTRRELYDQEIADARRNGYWDYLFINEKGEVTEGAISNLFIYNRGEYHTPPVSCGLLSGVMRENLLGSSAVVVKETALVPEDIYSAEAVFVTNSVRGVVRVQVERQ